MLLLQQVQDLLTPFLPDDPRIIDSTGSLELPSIPKNLLVIGVE
ncbi:MAG: hypothetical protein CM1200mP30_08530 [Pseudomonadota bacterium]|nr:MAG: hypothetical protein CM1200mP30_08530 [Pseudomonadota bacterium]